MSRCRWVWLALSMAVAAQACRQAGDSGLADAAKDVLAADAADDPDDTGDDPIDPAAYGCLGGTPRFLLDGIPWSAQPSGAGTFCAPAPWLNPAGLVRLPGGDWLVLGSIGLCCTDQFLDGLVRLDPSGALVASRTWTWNGLAWNGESGVDAWPLGDGAALAVWVRGGVEGGPGGDRMALEGLGPGLDVAWRRDPAELGDPVSLRRVARPGDPDLHLLAQDAGTADADPSYRLLVVAPDGTTRAITLPALPPGATIADATADAWWVQATRVGARGTPKRTLKFESVRLDYAGGVSSRAVIGPLSLGSEEHAWVDVWPLDPPADGWLAWVCREGWAGQPAPCTAWRVPRDGAAVKTAWDVRQPTGFSTERALRAGLREDGALTAIANATDEARRARPLWLVFPASGGAPVAQPVAFDATVSGGRGWRIDGWWPLDDGAAVTAQVLDAGEESPADGNAWRRADLRIARLSADGTVRWVRDLSDGTHDGILFGPDSGFVDGVAPDGAWVLRGPGSGAPWECPMFGGDLGWPTALRIFDRVCD